MDLLKSAGSLLATIAPTIASALAGPFAGMATNAVIGALGLAPETTSTEVLTAVAAAGPDQLLAIKQVEQQFLLDLKKLDISLAQLQYADTANARSREIVLQDYTPRILAGLVIGLYIGVQFYILGYVLAPEQINIVMRSLGTLDAAVALVLGYYFGSSVGSAKKTEQISELTKKSSEV